MSLFLQTLSGISSPKPPIWLMRQAGRYLPEYRSIRAMCPDFLSLCYTPNLATEVTLQPIRRFDFDAAILFSDILVVPDGLGIKTWFEEGVGPRLIPLKQNEIINYSPAQYSQKLAPVYEAVSQIRAQLSSDKALIGFSGAPWTLMTYIAAGSGGDKQEAALNWLKTNPETFTSNINILCEAIVAHCISQIDAGAQVIQIFDSWAHILSNDQLDILCIEPLRKIINLIKSYNSNIPIIIFPRGISQNSLIKFLDIGADSISINQDINIRSIIDYNVVFQGNLNPEILLGHSQDIINSAKKIMSDFNSKPFIFNLGHGILPHTPIENVHTLINAIRE